MEAIKILFLEDNPNDLELLLLELKREKFEFSYRLAETKESFLKELENFQPKVILSDYSLPQFSGLEALALVKEKAPLTPFIIISGTLSEEAAADCIKAGADDYLMKERLQRLGHAIRGALEKRKLRAEKEQIHELALEIEKRRELDRLKDGFLGDVSHELRNPLTVIKNVVDDLKEGLVDPLTAKQMCHVDIAQRNVARLVKMIGNLLNMTRLESGRVKFSPQKVNVSALIEERTQSLGFIARERQIVLDTELSGDLPECLLDPELIAQVLTNLLDNAIRFASKKVMLKAVLMNGESAGLKISVIDDGRGIPKERLGELFNKFVQINRPKEGDSYKGTGLGLAICKEIIKLHQGKIWVESDVGQGAQFHFIVPPS